MRLIDRTLKNAIKRTLDRTRVRSYELYLRQTNKLGIHEDFVDPAVKAALAAVGPGSDIRDHLSTIYYHALEVMPQLIVELGTRGGESTRVLLAVAERSNGQVLSVDVEDCRGLAAGLGRRWNFVQDDDISFGRARFASWCTERSLAPQIDVLFVDTSHLYEHTTAELLTWMPLVAPHGVAIFHDTNMRPDLFVHMDGSVSPGSWDNDRGVIRAIEEFLAVKYDETRLFVDCRDGFLIKHYPYCNGLTVLRKHGSR